eukprot:812665-Pelagomonas_calceolata.AAC.7
MQEVALHSPDMRQHIAWQLAYRGMMHAKIAEAGHRAKAESKAAEVKNVHVTLQVSSRHGLYDSSLPASSNFTSPERGVALGPAVTMSFPSQTFPWQSL